MNSSGTPARLLNFVRILPAVDPVSYRTQTSFLYFSSNVVIASTSLWSRDEGEKAEFKVIGKGGGGKGGYAQSKGRKKQRKTR